MTIKKIYIKKKSSFSDMSMLNACYIFANICAKNYSLIFIAYFITKCSQAVLFEKLSVKKI